MDLSLRLTKYMTQAQGKMMGYMMAAPSVSQPAKPLWVSVEAMK